MQDKILEDDEARYETIQACQEKEWEAKCTRCGACCGICARADQAPTVNRRATVNRAFMALELINNRAIDGAFLDAS